MAEEIKLPQPKQIKAEFVGEAELPTHYVNIVNVRAGVEEFFITLGTGIPPEIADIKDVSSQFFGERKTSHLVEAVLF